MRMVAPSASMLTVLCACSPSSTGSEPDTSALADVFREIDGATPLVHATRWESVPGDADPVRDPFLDVNDRCSPEAVSVETTDDGLYLDIDTTDCGWLTVEQPSLGDLAEGDTLRVWAFRWANVTAEGQGRFTVAAGDPPATLWEVRPDLPKDESELYYDDVVVQQAVPSGSPIYWHISNHGQNVWSLIQLLRVESDASGP